MVVTAKGKRQRFFTSTSDASPAPPYFETLDCPDAKGKERFLSFD